MNQGLVNFLLLYGQLPAADRPVVRWFIHALEHESPQEDVRLPEDRPYLNETGLNAVKAWAEVDEDLRHEVIIDSNRPE